MSIVMMIEYEVLIYFYQISNRSCLSVFFCHQIVISLRAERRRREARRETFTTPELVTTRRSILGPPAEGRPGPSVDYDDGDYGNDNRGA